VSIYRKIERKKEKFKICLFLRMKLLLRLPISKSTFILALIKYHPLRSTMKIQTEKKPIRKCLLVLKYVTGLKI
jgi:hypothetical protein